VQKKASETQYWLELLQDSGADNFPAIATLHRKATELLAIFTAIGKRLKD
jgi:hypothetical protein